MNLDSDKMFRLFLLLTLKMTRTLDPKDAASIKERIPEVIDMFCPGVNVCRENRSTNSSLTNPNFRRLFWMCCTECHCHSNCTEANTCCFPPKQPNLKTDNVLNTLKIERECLFPTTVQQNKVDDIYNQSFYMVTSVIEKVSNGSRMDNNAKIKCGDKIVAPWGSMFPVYSSMKKAIYKNILCAKADGVTDEIMWDAVLDCNLKQTHIESSISVIDFELDIFPHGCSVNFIPPTETKDIEALKCYASLIKTCSNTEFLPPDGTGLSTIDIIRMCECGFMSPLRDNKLYANVFCYICNTNFLLDTLYCNVSLLYNDREISADGFFGLIDSKFIDPNNGKIIHTRNPHLVCDSNDGSRCRPMFCPSGQLRDKCGKCQYLNKFWYNQTYVVNINLTLERSISIYEINDITNMLSGMTWSMKKKWRVESIAYEVTDDTRNATSFLVKVTYKASKIRPQYLMQNVKWLFKQKWELSLSYRTFDLKSSFSKVLYVYDRHSSLIAFGNASKQIRSPIFHVLHRTRMYFENIHFITKLNLCQQVEIISSEFIVNDKETFLIIIKTRKVLFEGEFLLHSSDYKSGKNARICFQDSGLFEMKNGFWQNTSLSFIVFVEIASVYWTTYLFRK